jgi:hopanoid biosynthesis associated protein HpnK
MDNLQDQQYSQQPTDSSKHPRFVVINGDDFGFSSGVNRAIVEAHDRGVLTSTSLMVTGAAFEEAVELAKARPNLAVGLHLVLTCGRSALPPNQIPHLVDSQGYFSDQPNYTGWRYQFSRAARRELPLEIRAQLEKFRQTGLPLSHVDGHLHLHVHPVVLRHLADLADEFKIRFIRLPSEELTSTLKIDRSDLWTKLLWFTVYGGLRRYGEHVLKKKGIQYVDRVYGLLQSGRMTEDYLLNLIPKIQADRVEIYSHPAIAIAGEPSNGPLGLGFAELEALLSEQVRDRFLQNGFRLTNYREQ